MKTITRFFLLILPFVLCFCSKDEDSDLPPFETIITQGTWIVSAYSEAGVNKTANYTGNTLKFNTGGTLTATKGTDTFSGNWSIFSSTRTLTFTIGTFDVALLALNGDWTVTSATLTDVQFVDGMDNLTLHKQ